jgi:SAM-dependent methyltransferase
MPADRSPAFAPRSPVRSLAYRGLLALAHALYRAGNGALFTAAGLLRRDELDAASIDQYRVFNISAMEVDAGLSYAEQHFYQRFLRRDDRVLLAGCGTGRDLIGVHALGCHVTGLEPIAEVVQLARQHLSRRGISATIDTGRVQSAELGGPYNAVIFSNGCYALLQGSPVRVAALSRVAKHLTADGRVIVSYHPATRQSAAGRWLTRTAAILSGADWIPESGDTFERDLFVPGLIRFHHGFTPSEFARECEAAGLAVRADEGYDEGYRFAVVERSA